MDTVIYVCALFTLSNRFVNVVQTLACNAELVLMELKKIYLKNTALFLQKIICVV